MLDFSNCQEQMVASIWDASSCPAVPGTVLHPLPSAVVSTPVLLKKQHFSALYFVHEVPHLPFDLCRLFAELPGADKLVWWLVCCWLLARYMQRFLRHPLLLARVFGCCQSALVCHHPCPLMCMASNLIPVAHGRAAGNCPSAPWGLP